MDSLLTIDEVSAWLKVSKNTLYHWVTVDKIPSVKIGGKRRFDPAEIRKWIKKSSSAA